MANKNIAIKYKTPTGYTEVAIGTNASQVQGLDEKGVAFGPYQISLPASGWNKETRKQKVLLSEVIDTDIVYCVKVLTGTKENMLKQQEAYNLLDATKGVNSLNGELEFYCTKNIPTVDLKIQVEWVR